MKILILEDSPERHKLFKQNLIGTDLTITEYVDECKKLMQENDYQALFLDHDLGGKVHVESGGDEQTGYDIAKWLSEKPEGVSIPQLIVVHSLNESGRKNIIERLMGLDCKIADAPFIWQSVGMKEAIEKVLT